MIAETRGLTEAYWALLGGILKQLRVDITKPSKATYRFACSYCRAYWKPECKKTYKQPWRAKCVRRALFREAEEAIEAMRDFYMVPDGVLDKLKEACME